MEKRGFLRIAFIIENTTNSTFSFSFNRMRATTDQGELFEPSTFIKQNFINPTKK